MGTRCTLFRPGLTPYQDAWQLQQRLAEGVRSGGDPTLVLLEHPPTFTLGARGAAGHLLLSHAGYRARGAEVHRTDRGGDVTYHGPGQLVGYPIIDLRRFGLGPVAYVRRLESVLIDTLSRFGIVSGRVPGRPGVWVGPAKVAAIGVRVSRGVTTHGFALNVEPDLSYFQDIVPCGLTDAEVASMASLLGEPVGVAEVEPVLAEAFAAAFGLDLIEEHAREEAVVGG